MTDAVTVLDDNLSAGTVTALRPLTESDLLMARRKLEEAVDVIRFPNGTIAIPKHLPNEHEQSAHAGTESDDYTHTGTVKNVTDLLHKYATGPGYISMSELYAKAREEKLVKGNDDFARLLSGYLAKYKTKTGRGYAVYTELPFSKRDSSFGVTSANGAVIGKIKVSKKKLEEKHLPDKHRQKDHGRREAILAGKHIVRETVSVEKEKYKVKSTGKIKTRLKYTFRYIDGQTGKVVKDKALIERIRKLVPPDSHDVLINPDPDAEVLALWLDKKNNPQSAYSKAHNQAAAAEKYGRLKDFNNKIKSIRKKILEDLESDNPRTRANAAVMYLVDKTGFRIGGTGVNYGASTLLGRHVKVDGDKVTFDFVGKKSVKIHQSLRDAKLAEIINERKSSKYTQPLFPETQPGAIRTYLKQVAGDDFMPKDFRTWNGTNEALKWIKKRKGPASSEAEFGRWQKEVSIKVSKKLGNNPQMSLNAYINPLVWSAWRKPEWGPWVPKKLRDD